MAIYLREIQYIGTVYASALIFYAYPLIVGVSGGPSGLEITKGKFTSIFWILWIIETCVSLILIIMFYLVSFYKLRLFALNNPSSSISVKDRRLLIIGATNAFFLTVLYVQFVIFTGDMIIRHPWILWIRQWIRFAHYGATPWIYLVLMKSLRKTIVEAVKNIGGLCCRNRCKNRNVVVPITST